MIHLHIGRHKTGSSALQRFLNANRTELGARGLVYLGPSGEGAALHEVANSMNPRWRARATPARLEAADVEARHAAQRLRSDGEMAASSEAFQNVAPELVARVFPAGRTRIVVYLREQLDYMLSAYAQAVQAQATRKSFVTFAGETSRALPYVDFLDRWAEVFGRDLIVARVYAREALDQGDIRRDFLARVGVDGEGLRFPKRTANPSISAELIEAKGLINAYVPQSVQSQVKLYSLFGQIAGLMPGRLRATAAFADRVRAKHAAANAEMFERYFTDGPDGFPMADLTGPPPAIDRLAALKRTLELLAELSPEAVEEIGRHLPSRPDLDRFPALLPDDWSTAAATIG